MSNNTTTNLYQQAALNTDDAFSQGKIIDSLSYDMRAYLDYLNTAIETVNMQGAIKVPLMYKEVRNDEFRFHVRLKGLKTKSVEKIENELFSREIKTVYLEKPNGNYHKNKALEVNIIDRNEEEKYLILDTEEQLEHVYIKANDYQLRMQKNAIMNLWKNPKNVHKPIIKLFQQSEHAKPYFSQRQSPDSKVLNWNILTDETRNGTNEQRDFVNKALESNDFALLEGPPGSGKTTAIIELIIQLVKQNKRILLVSATHVAIDNVIHRILTKYKAECEGLAVPIRIGDRGNIRKESVKEYRMQDFIGTTKRKITKNLRNKDRKSCKTLHGYLQNPDKNTDAFDNLIFNSSNLVAGTMIGVLQYPGIKDNNKSEMFDVLITDESSKVTFLDFLVPALHAKKWILVGDKNQLSPYVEDDYLNDHIEKIIPDKKTKHKIISQFKIKRELAFEHKNSKQRIKILFDKNARKEDFEAYGEVFEVNSSHTFSEPRIIEMNSADLIICSPDKMDLLAQHLYMPAEQFNGKIRSVSFQNRQKRLDCDKIVYNDKEERTWGEMAGSRLNQYYQYRFEQKYGQEIKQELDILVPKNLQSAIDNIRKITFPSILELLQIGIGETYSKKGKRQSKIIYNGFEQYKEIRERKFQSLSYQHRMHDQIARIPRDFFYEGKNLLTANTVLEREDLLSAYKPTEDRVIWKTNNNKAFRRDKKNHNPSEAKHIESELRDFIKFAGSKTPIEKYEVAVLTFYRDQERALRKMLQKLTKQHKNTKFFSAKNVNITVCTVDKFQGDEADLVLLSFVVFKKRAFYHNPNRLNVALTRARHKMVLFGNQAWLKKKAGTEALNKLALEFDSRTSVS